MIVQNRVIGIIDVYTREKRTFQSWEKEWLATFASQAALAIGQANLALHSQKIGSLALAGNYEKLADYTVKAVHDLTDLPVILWMMSGREDEKGTKLRIAALSGINNDESGYKEKQTTSAIYGESITSIALKNKCTVKVYDILNDSDSGA